MKRCLRLLVAGCCTALTVAGASASRSASYGSFAWDSITPSEDLEYHDCYGDYKCARLRVPLNWLNETDTREATIAMVKLPAVVPDDDPNFGGAVFSNPGGPGGSGVEFMLQMGHYLRYTVDKPGRRHYEIISFDPRGVGNTLPASDCFNNNLLSRDAFLLESRGNGPLTNGDSTIAYSLAIMDAFGQRCSQAGDAMAFFGTPSVARDMVEMIDKVDELRKRDAAQRPKRPDAHDDPDARVELRKRFALKRKPAKLHDEPGHVPRLQFIGFSYGTILGNYFASMFPGRVGRLVLDGVCDVDDYATGPGWLANTVDTDEIFDTFFEGCAAVGPEVCALARESDAHGASDIRRRFDSFLLELDQRPKSVLLESGDVVIVTSWDVRNLIGTVLYKPMGFFRLLADKLNNFMSGDMNEMAVLVLGLGMMPVVKDACPLDNLTDIPRPYRIVEAQNAVVCSDGDDISHKDVSWWRKYVRRQLDTSDILGATWSTIRLPCSSWRFRASWQFKGPFTTPEPDLSLKSGRPAAPILFLSNRLDPVTPLRAAQAMAAKHPGARVIIQEALGHCAVASAPSKCTKNAVADYFESGIIPSDLSTCSVECSPWDQSCPSASTNGAKGSDAEAVSSWFDREQPLWHRRSPLGLL
ncbi:TAP-like domain-containing protein [Trichoderma ceciliae]